MKQVNELSKTFQESWKREKKEREQQLKEAIAGERDFWMVVGFCGISVYPAYDKTAIYICGGDLEKYKQSGYLKVLPKNRLQEFIKLRGELITAREKYQKFVSKVFKEVKNDSNKL